MKITQSHKGVSNSVFIALTLVSTGCGSSSSPAAPGSGAGIPKVTPIVEAAAPTDLSLPAALFCGRSTSFSCQTFSFLTPWLPFTLPIWQTASLLDRVLPIFLQPYSASRFYHCRVRLFDYIGSLPHPDTGELTITLSVNGPRYAPG